MKQIWVRVNPFPSHMVLLMSVANTAWWCGAPANVWLSLGIFHNLAHLHMQIRGVKPKNPTSFSLSELGPSTVVKHQITDFPTYLRPWALAILAEPPKNRIFENSSERLPDCP